MPSDCIVRCEFERNCCVDLIWVRIWRVWVVWIGLWGLWIYIMSWCWWIQCGVASLYGVANRCWLCVVLVFSGFLCRLFVVNFGPLCACLCCVFYSAGFDVRVC